MKETTNYHLRKPDPEDFYNIEDFNHNADLLDAALKDLEDTKLDTSGGTMTGALTLPSANPTADFQAVHKKYADDIAAGKAPSAHKHAAGDITSGVVPIERGGTGQTTAAGVRNALGLGNTTGAVPITNGGTGATTAAQALANLGGLPLAGGTITGNLRLKGSGNYGNILNFGDSDYVHISEPSDDNMEIKAKNINIAGQLIAQSNTNYGTPQARNIYFTTSDLTAGSSSLASGSICFVYE